MTLTDMRHLVPMRRGNINLILDFKLSLHNETWCFVLTRQKVSVVTILNRTSGTLKFIHRRIE